VAERSVFERGWPTAVDAWRHHALETPMGAILELRALVNRQLEACRSGGSLGASLEAQVQLELRAGSGDAAGALQEALTWLASSSHPSVDNLADWLLVSALQIGGEPPAAVLSEASDAGITVRVAKAAGDKCERCWHYESDIGQHPAHPTLCGRCAGVLGG
jgi:isoleucyl-tRNA synthetase